MESQPQVTDEPLTSPPPTLRKRLIELARLFLKLGLIGFGGPQAHIAMINDEAVVRRQWMTQEQFSEGLAICEMLPGPASTQVGIYTGYLRAGQIGALVAGLAFIAPAFVIVLLLSWAYFRYQGVPQIENLFLGISPVVTAIILGFCWKLGKRTVQNWPSAAVAIAVLLITWLSPMSVLLQFIVAGLLGVYLYSPGGPFAPNANLPKSGSQQGWWLPLSGSLLPHALPPMPYALATVSADTLSLSGLWGWERIQTWFWPLALFFLKVGAFIFGGGLVIIPLLEFEVVNQLQWLTPTEFINGVAIGQVTPGPVVITAAFVGYKVAGVLGALTAAVAIFTPSFAFIMLAAPALQRLRRNPRIKAFLRGIMPAVLGAIAAAAIPLGQSAIVQDSLVQSLGAGLIGIGALVALVRYKIQTWQLVGAGALLGLLLGQV